jgi:hypothetical protein
MASLMDVISTDEKATETTNVLLVDDKPAHGVDLSELLAGYKEPAKIEPDPAATTAPAPTPTPTPQINTQFPGAPHWYGNPMYYQSGKKQGQLKPPPKNGNAAKAIFQTPNMSVNPEPSILTADSIITGALFLTIINLLIPMAFAMINNLLVKDKRKVIDYEHLQIDDKQLKQLEGLADKALKQIKIEANPVGVFLFALVGMYGMQFMTVKMLTDQSVKK